MSDFYLVGRGQISGTYCDTFWRVNQDGTLWDWHRQPTDLERRQILSDAARHREKIMGELTELDAVVTILAGEKP